jgi:hypothetical protein
MRQLFQHFDRNREYMLCLLRHSRYPLITMVHKESGIDFQVVASNDTSRSRAIIDAYTDENPHLFGLFAIVKAMLDIRGLGDVYRGGLGSYTLFMMVVAAIKVDKNDNINMKRLAKVAMRLRGGRQVRPSLQLMVVLQFYRIFNPYRHALALNPLPVWYAKHELGSDVPEADRLKMEKDAVRQMQPSYLKSVC